MAQYRADVSAGGKSEDDEGSYWGGIAQAARDPFTWMFAAIHFFLIIAQSFKDFLPSVSIPTAFPYDIPISHPLTGRRLLTPSASAKLAPTSSKRRRTYLPTFSPLLCHGQAVAILSTAFTSLEQF